MPKPRKESDRKPKSTLKIFCEGEKTEPHYIKGYLDLINASSRKSVVTIQATTKNTPVQLVDAAVEAKLSRKSLDSDQFWVVYDREAVSKYSDTLHARARDRANAHGIKVALTNVCFEYWLLLHMRDTNAPYTSYQDLRNRSPFRADIQNKIGTEYEKAGYIFKYLQDGITEARQRAALINARGRAMAPVNRNAEHQINPYVGVADLLDAIDAFT